MGEITEIIRDRIQVRVERFCCRLGMHVWRDHPAVVASEFPAVNDAGEVVGSYIPTKGVITRTSPAYSLTDPSRPVNWPKFDCYFQHKREEHPAFTACRACGVRK